MALSKTTQDHDEIQQWAEARGAKPAAVASTESETQTGILRLMFPDAPNANDDSLEEISWDEFFEKFDASGLEFLYQEETADGQQSNFNKLTYPEEGSPNAKKTMRRASKSSSKSAGKKTAGKVAAKKSASKKAAPKKVAPKKVAPKKVAPKKAAPKKAAKKTPAKKGAVKNAAKKAPLKATAKKAVAKKAVAKKAVAKKTAPKKATAKKSATKKSAAKKGGRR